MIFIINNQVNMVRSLLLFKRVLTNLLQFLGKKCLLSSFRIRHEFFFEMSKKARLRQCTDIF